MRILNYLKRSQQYLLGLAALFMLSACSEQVSTVEVASDGSSVLKMSPPAFLNPRAVVVSNLVLEVRINRQIVEMVQTGDIWEGQTTVPVGSDVALEVSWSELFGSRNLPLAIARKTEYAIDNNIRFDVLDSGYETDGTDFDADGDSISNLTERRQDTNPYDANSPGNDQGVAAAAVVPATTLPNTIDGVFPNLINGVQDTTFWDNAYFTGVGGEDLLINNLIVDVAGDAIDGNTNYQWGGAHDEEFLSLFVFGKSINPAAGVEATRDSGIFTYEDDSLEIYIDGDLSAGNGYDEVDDLHIIIPLLRNVNGTLEPNRSGETTSEIYFGGNVSAAVKAAFDLNAVEYGSCRCDGQRMTWEVRINMAAANIPLGKTFGFDVQINQDDDGGGRDTKWSWASDSITQVASDVNPDRTWRSPKYMGTMKLQPF